MHLISIRRIAVLFFTVICFSVNAQIVSGPLIGHTELRSSQIWLHLEKNIDAKSVQLKLNDGTIYKAASDNNGFYNIVRFQITDLQPGSEYNYSITANGKSIAAGNIKTQSLWQWRTDPPSFSFITGSCAYFNQPQYDRPGKPYGGDSSIFLSMAKERSDFMLWLGDNWYTREADYYSEFGLNYRPAHERSLKVMQPFWKAMPHYAIWDDHDYGFNDGDKSYPLKEASRNVFKSFWSNPSYGMNNEGIYTKFTWNDVDVFMLDDRFFRSNDDMPDSLNGMPNGNKRMFGEKQMEWLKNALLQSNSNANINFRIIATGSQVLNPMSPFDCLRHFTKEYNELMDFLKQTKINGVVFLTGDRHHSEIIKAERAGTYPLYDITASPLTSSTHKFGGPEKDNPYRVVGVDQLQNYTKISFSGKHKDRTMNVEFLGVKGEKLAEWSIKQKQISNEK